jgi:protein-glutamine gamma-glutamyltransferase
VPRATDPVARADERLCKRLAAVGLQRNPSEGPEAFATRVAATRPDLAPMVGGLCRRYSRLRYAALRSDVAAATFIAGVRAFKPSRSQPR